MAFVREKGFTLLELMLVIALLAILAAIAMPSYKNFIDNQKIRSVLNEWQSSFYFAQKEAMRTKMPVILCGSTDGKTCNKKPNSSDFSAGWVVLSDSKVLQESVQLDPRIKVTTTGNQFSTNGIVFLSTGRIKNHASGSVTIEIVEISGGKNSAVPNKTLTISSAGRLIGEKR